MAQADFIQTFRSTLSSAYVSAYGHVDRVIHSSDWRGFMVTNVGEPVSRQLEAAEQYLDTHYEPGSGAIFRKVVSTLAFSYMLGWSVAPLYQVWADRQIPQLVTECRDAEDGDVIEMRSRIADLRTSYCRRAFGCPSLNDAVTLLGLGLVAVSATPLWGGLASTFIGVRCVCSVTQSLLNCRNQLRLLQLDKELSVRLENYHPSAFD
ncbi:hypothetical protein [Parendozoicomonas haliclonae]|uniref:Uncharacterized protein n=1 Tax=Parendozoicomonas haliclonae TaxID=1960125 RepID=A0A1X7AFQ2_9GAMM|nr:hypothetical protein [Parendozoicomonas haliclonae]SMA36446.1 hypothetical protein EHSB41UT_00646 [Parendozoicomonas haliclonae]